MEEDKPDYRISWIEGGFMIGVALVYDLIQIGLEVIMLGFGWTVNWVINIYAMLTFWFWFKLKGVSFVNPKRALFGSASIVIKFIPWLDALPTWTALTVTTIVSARTEDFLARHPVAGAVGQAAVKTATKVATKV